MIRVFFLLAIFGPNIYFSVLATIGQSYGGIEEGNISYWVYLLLLLIITSLVFFFKIIQKRTILYKEVVMLFGFILFLGIFSFYNAIYYSNIPPESLKQIIFFVIFVVPAILAGWYFSSSRKKLSYLSKNIEVIMLILTCGIFVSTFSTIITGSNFESIGGATYQSTSYISAYAFGINLYYLLWGENIVRYDVFKKKKYKYLQTFMLVVQIVSLVVGGGRGAFILLVNYIFLYILTLLFQNKFKKILKHLKNIGLFSIILWVVFEFFIQDSSIIINGINRITAFISPEGINWEGTSGRDAVYTEVLETVKKNPVFGVGFFNYILPHNLFLEILVATGVIGLTFFMLFAGIIIKKIMHLIRNNFQYFLLVVISMYPVTMLMFSGTLFRSSELWFVVSYVYFLKPLKFSKTNSIVE